ncbi:Hypothetical predicted protein [Drosophila guanche]|uniref:Uncharacterized protein n=1 Tax=Drosophila guanche TaxID=7266 RepID=A0A3B0JS02_DROGU|nr:Hypothetical predicted protein [Drosophila guanche]
MSLCVVVSHDAAGSCRRCLFLLHRRLLSHNKSIIILQTRDSNIAVSTLISMLIPILIRIATTTISSCRARQQTTTTTTTTATSSGRPLL